MADPIDLDPSRLPRHIAIIMDGNGRWAQKKGLLRTFGHKAGVDSVRNIVKAAREIGIQFLTLYAFSTENWQRPATEVNTLMGLLKTFLEKELANMQKNNIRLLSIGQKGKIPAAVQDVLDKVIAETADNTGLTLTLALNYGARLELINAVQIICRKVASGQLDIDAIDETTISQTLYTAGVPDPDLLIRTGGEARISNFLLWQISYSEIYFTQTHWPDFRREQLNQAILNYQKRQRRFGKTGDQVQSA